MTDKVQRTTAESIRKKRYKGKRIVSKEALNKYFDREEFNLSEKIGKFEYSEFIQLDDVKEFIKRLKEEMKDITFQNKIQYYDEIIGDTIDKLAGDELTK